MIIKRCTLILRDTKDNDVFVSDEALEVMYRNCNENDYKELGVKLLISMCLFGPDHRETQRIGFLLRERF